MVNTLVGMAATWGVSREQQAANIRLGYDRHYETADFRLTCRYLVDHLHELLADRLTKHPPRRRREVRQVLTQYRTQRVEPSFSEAIDRAEEEVGG